MTSLKFWQSVLVVLWVFAILGGGYYFYDTIFGADSCPVNVQSVRGARSCGEAQTGNIQQNDFLRYDITSPLGAALLEKEKPNLLH